MLLLEDEIFTDIIVFVDIPIEECAHIEEISRCIYDCGGSVQRVPMKKFGKIVMYSFRKKLNKKVGAPGKFKRKSFFHENISFLVLIFPFNTFVCIFNLHLYYCM